MTQMQKLIIPMTMVFKRRIPWVLWAHPASASTRMVSSEFRNKSDVKYVPIQKLIGPMTMEFQKGSLGPLGILRLVFGGLVEDLGPWMPRSGFEVLGGNLEAWTQNLEAWTEDLEA